MNLLYARFTVRQAKWHKCFLRILTLFKCSHILAPDELDITNKRYPPASARVNCPEKPLLGPLALNGRIQSLSKLFLLGVRRKYEYGKLHWSTNHDTKCQSCTKCKLIRLRSLLRKFVYIIGPYVIKPFNAENLCFNNFW